MMKKIFDQNNIKSHEYKYIILFLFLSSFFLTTTIILSTLYKNELKRRLSTKIIFNRKLEESSDDRYIKIISNVSEEGPHISKGNFDVKNSQYFKYIDVYNMESSGSLILLEKFKTYQQTSEYTCGLASLIMAAYYIDGNILNETDLAIKVKVSKTLGTNIVNLEKLIRDLGYEYESKSSFVNDNYPSNNSVIFSEYIKESLRNKEPIIVLSNDWGGHYSVIIGYDDMGTEDYTGDDVLILADPYDTSDHSCDGYTIFSYERYYAQMQVTVFDIEGQDLNFIKLKRKKTNSN